VPASPAARIGVEMTSFRRKAWRQEEGQHVAEYAVMLAVVLAIAMGPIRLIGSRAGNVFDSVDSAIQ
jgi:Flp pilus assembly pilin Flp